MSSDITLSIIGILLSVLAIGLAVSPFAQLIWGRPKLVFDTDDFTGTGGKILVVRVKNLPTSKWLRRLGVERAAGNVQASIDVQEQGTNKFVIRGMPGLIQCPPIRNNGLLVQALPGFAVGVVVFGIGKNATGKEVPGIVDPRRPDILPISQGYYTVYAHIICGEQVYHFTKTLKVGAKPHETFWY